MWCVKSVEKTSNPGYLSEPVQVINLIDYDTGEKSFFYRYEEKNGTKIDKWENGDIVEVGTICGYCGDFFYAINKPLYKLISIIESIDLIGTTGIPESFKIDKAIYQVDLHGVVYKLFNSDYIDLLQVIRKYISRYPEHTSNQLAQGYMEIGYRNKTILVIFTYNFEDTLTKCLVLGD